MPYATFIMRFRRFIDTFCDVSDKRVRLLRNRRGFVERGRGLMCDIMWQYFDAIIGAN